MRFTNKKTSLKHFFKKIEHKTLPKSTSIQEHYRFYSFMYIFIVVSIAIPLNLIGLTGPNDFFYFLANCANFLACILIFILFYSRKISLIVAISALLISNQLEIAVETIHASIYASNYNSHLIIGNMVLSSVIILLSILTYIPFLPLIMSMISISFYGLSILITHNEIHQNFFILFTIIFTGLSLLGKKLIITIEKLEHENASLKKDEAEMIRVLRIHKPQIMAYIEFSKKTKSTSEDMEKLMELIGERPQRNIINTVSNYLTEKYTEITNISKAFPELTLSEHEVVRLIIQGKKLTEICEILQKSESNISAHRGHIRKKLALKTHENLQLILTNRLREFLDKQA